MWSVQETRGPSIKAHFTRLHITPFCGLHRALAQYCGDVCQWRSSVWSCPDRLNLESALHSCSPWNIVTLRPYSSWHPLPTFVTTRCSSFHASHVTCLTTEQLDELISHLNLDWTPRNHLPCHYRYVSRLTYDSCFLPNRDNNVD